MKLQFTEATLWPAMTILLSLLLTLGAATGVIKIGTKPNPAQAAYVTQLECQLDSIRNDPHYCIPRELWERNKKYGDKLPTIKE
jgi:hypothetical protein